MGKSVSALACSQKKECDKKKTGKVAPLGNNSEKQDGLSQPPD